MELERRGRWMSAATRERDKRQYIITSGGFQQLSPTTANQQQAKNTCIQA